MEGVSEATSVDASEGLTVGMLLRFSDGARVGKFGQVERQILSDLVVSRSRRLSSVTGLPTSSTGPVT